MIMIMSKQVIGSTDSDSLAFEDLEGAVVVVAFVAVDVDVAVVGLVLDFAKVGVVDCGWVVVVIAVLLLVEEVSECGVFVESDGFELSIGVEAEDDGCDVVNEADAGVDVYEEFHVGEFGWIYLILDGCKEVDHEGDGEVDADEDEDHEELVATLMLYEVEDKDEEDTEDGLCDKFFGCNKVKDYD